MLSRILLVALLSNVSALTSTDAYAQGATYRDQDWNISLVDNCGLPRSDSVEMVTLGNDKKIKFTLREGDKGRCSTDDRARHRAPYWERAELTRKKKMSLGHRYLLSAEVEFVAGFRGQRETFMQIHGWAQNCQGAFPSVMLKFKNGLLVVETLRGATTTGSGRHRNTLKQQIKIDTLLGKQSKFTLDFDARTKPARFSLFLGQDVLVADQPADFSPCAEPSLKMGIYRPGGKGSRTSTVVFDDIQIKKLD